MDNVMKTPDQLYLNDPVYHAIVESLVHYILEYQVTPSEIREMAVFAAVRAENLKSYERRIAEKGKF